MSLPKLFVISLLLTTCGLLAAIYVHRPKHPRSLPPDLVRISDDLYITSQLQPANVRYLKRRGIKTVVDMRPDGEVADQPSSSEIESASKKDGLGFHYIPVPHESIPESAVDSLDYVLSPEAMPAVLYCRTGRRAVRLFALVEASRVDGPGADAIVEMVRAAGFSAEDLRNDIAQRLSHRQSTSTVNH